VKVTRPAVGERMVADEVAYLGAKAAEMLAEYQRLQPAHKLLTFADVERLWEQVVRPKLDGFRTMQKVWPGREPVPEDSVWYANSLMPDLPPAS